MNTLKSEYKQALGAGFNNLTDICHLSFDELRKKVKDKLSWSQTQSLYLEAQQVQKDNLLHEARILKRANPHLQSAVHLALTALHADQEGYNSRFGNRASKYAAPGAISSMFSPAAYLTELYRQARNLHAENSIYHLDKRRPDLKSLVLSQKNMNTEISTLSLSNSMLLNSIKAQPELDSYAKVMKKLSTFRTSGSMPYHDAYESVRKIIQLQAPVFEQFNASPAIAGLMHQASLLGINASISPELFNILTEEITEGNAEELYKKNFGNIEPASLAMPEYLKRYYNLSDEELSQFIGKASNFGQQEYSNNQLITPVVNSSDGTVKVYRITREYTKNDYQMDAELFPFGGENYRLDYKFKNFYNASYLSIKLNNKRELVRTEGAPQVNIEYSANITLNTADISQPFEIGLTRVIASGSWSYAPAKFTVEEYNQYSFLLKLNKAIRLSRATELSPTILEGIVRSVNPQLDINTEVLGKVFLTKYYMQRYGIDAETALILCKAPISENPSHPDLTKLLADIHQLTIDELSLLLEIINEGTINLSEITHDNLTVLIDKLYAVTGWLRTRKWSVYQLFVMTTDKYNETLTPEIHNLLDTIYNGLQNFYKDNLLKIKDNLLKAKESLPEDKDNLPKAEKYLLAAEKYLLEANKNPLEAKKALKEYEKNQEAYEKNLKEHEKYLLKAGENLPAIKENLLKIKENLPKAISPYIAAALQLPSENVALSVLAWADKLNSGKENKMTADSFWNWLRKNPFGTQSSEPTGTTASDNSIQQAVQYCQCLAQLALIYRSTNLSESTLRLFVTKPQHFVIKTKTTETIEATETTETIPAHDVSTLMSLTRFADWVNSLGKNASSVLTEFEKKTLTTELLANAMNLDEKLLSQAKTQAETDLSNWPSIDSLLQWINISHQLNISPQGVSTLEQVLTAESPADYTQWENVAATLTTGLDTQKANTLHAFLGESRSAALSTYYIYSHNQKDREERKHTVIKDRDDLYQYLLIDNQVSAAIKTTEIAEAIASIQLYINRALKNMEGDTDTSVTSRSFFTNWDKYNKRYSTWAGIAKLLYYPENYIDPTLRIGQTKMMDTLLQSISQSQLNTDTVEDAFKSYLTSFEQVANLEVISAYHDNINNNQGLTYFIGRSKTEVNQYYWRSVDHNKFSEGKFPANAWSEWHKIDCPINPYEDTIRPVVYQSRLYIIWLEQKKMTKQEGDKTTSGFSYELKLAHIRYDGTWNTPVTFDVNNKISTLNPEAKSKSLGLYCASYQGKDKLLVMFYKKQEQLNNYTEKTNTHTAPIEGLYITSNMSPEEMTPESYRLNAHKQFDTNNVIRVNNRYAESYEIPSSINSNNGYDWGEGYLSMVYGGSILITRDPSDNSKIQISPKLRIIHNGYEGRQRNQCNLMKKYGKLGDKFIIYTTLGINPNNLSNKKLIYPVYQYGNTQEKGKLLFYRDSATNFTRAWFPNLSSDSKEMSTITGGNISGNYGYIENKHIDNKHSDNKHSDNKPFEEYFYMDDHGGIDTDVSEPICINTKIQPSNVKVIRKATGIEEKTFIASKNNNVPIEPTPNFEEMYYQFKSLEEIDVSNLTYNNNNEASIDITFTAFADAFDESSKKRNLGEEHFSIRIIKKANVNDVLTLHHDPSGAQYMQWGAYRTRLNTLFARKLISQANAGINTILSMETQNIQEPQLGYGFYIAITVPKYNADKHGTNRKADLVLNIGSEEPGDHTFWSGTLTDTKQQVTLFVPISQLTIEPYDPFMSLRNLTGKLGIYLKCQKGRLKSGILDENKSSLAMTTFTKESSWDTERDLNVVITSDNTEPMDFNGANSLYFWELFYYTPMLIAQRLLHEQNFDEANRWLKYVWNPSGHIANGQKQHPHNWNVRPLQEDTSWNDDPLDTFDPDAIAQHDPMHYKVATFMRALDLLIEQGDYAYRQLERDTLAEAKMWYMQALHLLGDKPHLPLSSTWSDPELEEAADLEKQQAHAKAIADLRQGQPTWSDPKLKEAAEQAVAKAITDLLQGQSTWSVPKLKEAAEQAFAKAITDLLQGQSTWSDPKLKEAAEQALAKAITDLLQGQSTWSDPKLKEAAEQALDKAIADLRQGQSTWSDLKLKEAAEQALNKAIADLRQGQPTSGSNTDLFLPQVNEVMLSYWQKLEQRLYNLRHNLSIDGQPLHLPIFATPADPKALLSAAVASSQGGNNLPSAFISVWRFPHMLENARSMVSQLTQFGSTLQNIIERQDAEALNTLLQNQAAELILTNLNIQDKTIEELDAEKTVLEKTRAGAQSRFDSYSKFYDEDINAGEKQAMALRASVAGISTALQASHLAGAALDLAPNIFGFADGGSHWGAIAKATGNVMEFSASVMSTEADKISQSEAYRRRRQEWEIQRNNAEAELKQIDAQLQSLVVRREAAVLQKTSLKTQQEQTHAQLTFLQHKFSNQALYNWLRGRLSAIYFQFYDLTVARCLMAEMAYRWETNDAAARFIKPGAWQGTHAGLLAGETLMLNLAQMEDAHLKQEQRVLEVERTVSLAEVYKEKGQFSLTEKIAELVNKKPDTTSSRNNTPSFGSGSNTLKFGTENALASLQASISLADLQIRSDYPEGSGVGNVRRIKQISVTLPALLGPYQDVQAILSYGGDATGLAKGCKALAVSHGMNDSGQFQLDFNDGKFLPFEGIEIDKGTLTLSFPNATEKQKTMLESLSDIILHIRYTIRQ
ncbi:neuraminidase-like domain-containing protein [Photorhabdus aegyptia]|uniref:Tc toxin subunit A-related protein n=1 Tax=Photorhabdus aegyptia TaxID=2805098 RepID=UPI001E36C391|nr:neuraminidase-like domain-containing protein [Photorhabdus aegyptia]